MEGGPVNETQAWSEPELLARCRSGDNAAWDALFDAHYAAAGRFVFQLNPSFTREDVEEICQDTFLSVVRSLQGFNGHCRLQTWIFRIATNKARDFRERRDAAKRGGGQAPISLQAEQVETGLALDPPAPGPGPAAELERSETWAALRRCLDEMGNPCREIIELRYFGELSYEETSASLKLNVKTVSSRLSKCLDRLEALVRPGREEGATIAV